VLVLVLKLTGIAGFKIFMFPDNARPVGAAAAVARACWVHRRSEAR